MDGASSERGKYAQVQSHPTSNQPKPSRPNEKTQGRRSWRAPTCILAALLLGLGTALAHHFMNKHLNGKPVSDVRVSQAWISRFNTALAFLVKTAFAVSVGTAFVQRQWLRLHQQSFSIGEVDSLTSVIGNVFSFFSSPVWLRHPILLLIALVSWSIPFAAIVTPGSLSVQPVRTTTTTNLQVPQPSFNQSNYGFVQEGGGGLAVSGDNRLYKLAYNTASSAQPVSFSSKYQNETYHLQFVGPTVRCGPAKESVVKKLTPLYGIPAVAGGGTGGETTPFLSWVAGDEQQLNTSIGSGTQYFPTLDSQSQDAARIFVMSNTGYYGKTIQVPANYGPSTIPVTEVNVTECLLYNATYDVDFAFNYPQQTSHTIISRWLNPVAAPATGFDTNYSANVTAAAITSYSSMMDAFGKLLVGIAIVNHYSIDTSYFTSWNIMSIDWSRAEAVQQGLEQLFQNFTLSLLSDEGLIKNSTEAELVPVIVTSYPITYVYNQFDLILAYGLSFLFALICSIVGLHAFFINNASYQNLFSTFLRAMNGPTLRSSIEFGDSGADPLPKGLAGSRVKIGTGQDYAL